MRSLVAPPPDSAADASRPLPTRSPETRTSRHSRPARGAGSPTLASHAGTCSTSVLARACGDTPKTQAFKRQNAEEGEQPDGLQPAQVPLDALAPPLAHLIARVPRGAPIQRTGPLRRVLRHVRGDGEAPEGGHEVPGVVTLVGS